MLASVTSCAHDHDASYFNFLDTVPGADGSLVHRFECYVCDELREHVDPIPPDSPDTAANVVRHARTLLTPPGTWLDSSYAVDTLGNDVDPAAESACAWCLVGAVRRYLARLADPTLRPYTAAVVYNGLSTTAKRVFGIEHDRVRAEHPDTPAELFVAFLNDANGRTHEQILEWCDQTVTALAQ